MQHDYSRSLQSMYDKTVGGDCDTLTMNSHQGGDNEGDSGCKLWGI